MARFTVRIELFGKADEEDYEALHKKMQEKKYFRVIEGSDEKWYHLPTAEYNHTATEPVSKVYDQVWAIAKAVWHDPGVLVTESENRRWGGLRIATANEVKKLTS